MRYCLIENFCCYSQFSSSLFPLICVVGCFVWLRAICNYWWIANNNARARASACLHTHLPHSKYMCVCTTKCKEHHSTGSSEQKMLIVGAGKSFVLGCFWCNKACRIAKLFNVTGTLISSNGWRLTGLWVRDERNIGTAVQSTSTRFTEFQATRYER